MRNRQLRRIALWIAAAAMGIPVHATAKVELLECIDVAGVSSVPEHAAWRLTFEDRFRIHNNESAERAQYDVYWETGTLRGDESSFDHRVPNGEGALLELKRTLRDEAGHTFIGRFVTPAMEPRFLEERAGRRSTIRMGMADDISIRFDTNGIDAIDAGTRVLHVSEIPLHLAGSICYDLVRVPAAEIAASATVECVDAPPGFPDVRRFLVTIDRTNGDHISLTLDFDLGKGTIPMRSEMRVTSVGTNPARFHQSTVVRWFEKVEKLDDRWVGVVYRSQLVNGDGSMGWDLTREFKHVSFGSDIPDEAFDAEEQLTSHSFQYATRPDGESADPTP